MRRLFGRTPGTEPSQTALRDVTDAHGCPACPHSPKPLHDFDENGATTLLPAHHTDIEGHSFELAGAVMDDSIDFEDDVDGGDFDLD